MENICITLKNMQQTTIQMHQVLDALDYDFFEKLNITNLKKWRELCIKHGFFLDIVGYNMEGLSFVYSLSIGFVLKDETAINKKQYKAPYLAIRVRVRLTEKNGERRNDFFKAFILGLEGLNYFVVAYEDTSHNHSGKEIVIPFNLCDNYKSTIDLLPKLKPVVVPIVSKINVILKHKIFNGRIISTSKAPKDGEFMYKN